MIYELLLGGVLSSVLIPLLVKAEEEDEDGGVAYTQRLLSIATAALAAMTLAGGRRRAAGSPPLSCRPGSQRELTGIFATLLLPEIFFYGLGAMFIAVLNIKHVYGPGAWSPLLNNVIMIVTIGVFWLLPGPDTLEPGTITTAQMLVLGIGTTLGIAGAGPRAGPGAAPHRFPLAVAVPGPARREPDGCRRSARSPGGCSATSWSARSASRSSSGSATTTADSPSSPTPTCCSRCPTASSSSPC